MPRVDPGDRSTKLPVTTPVVLLRLSLIFSAFGDPIWNVLFGVMVTVRESSPLVIGPLSVRCDVVIPSAFAPRSGGVYRKPRPSTSIWSPPLHKPARLCAG